MTGYLGGAIATQLRAGNPLFSHVLFGAYLGALAWWGLYLREPRLRELFASPAESENTLWRRTKFRNALRGCARRN
jgi:hypothetical protein